MICELAISSWARVIFAVDCMDLIRRWSVRSLPLTARAVAERLTHG